MYLRELEEIERIERKRRRCVTKVRRHEGLKQILNMMKEIRKNHKISIRYKEVKE